MFRRGCHAILFLSNDEDSYVTGPFPMGVGDRTPIETDIVLAGRDFNEGLVKTDLNFTFNSYFPADMLRKSGL